MCMLISFIGSICTLVADSGLAKVLEFTFSGVAKLWNGKKFPQNVITLRLVMKELQKRDDIYVIRYEVDY